MNISAQNKPNIVVFLADDVGMDLGCYGNKGISTPNLDNLAKNGVCFEKAFLTSPQSSPSRTSMLTGMFAHTIGTEDLHEPLDENTKILPYYLKKAGYYTGIMLKRHLGANGDKQFDRIIKGDYYPHQGDLQEEAFLNFESFIRDSDQRPFFIWVGFNDAHRPYNRNNCKNVNDPSAVLVPPFLVDSVNTRRDLADYYDEISRMDTHVGRMIGILEKMKKMDNTIIVFLSDNGSPFPRCKGTLYDTGIQTPLIFSWKNVFPSGKKHSNGLISTIDLAATLLHFAGVKMDNNDFSKSFHELIYDPSKRGREYIFAERNWHDTDEYMRCVRTETMKLIFNAYYELPHGTSMDLSTSLSWYDLRDKLKKERLLKKQMQIFVSPRPMVEIYDLTKDPYELDNVADCKEYLAKGKQLKSELLKWQKDTNDHPWWRRRRPDMNDRITGFPLFPRQEFYMD